MIVGMLKSKYGFQLPDANRCHFEPTGPWDSGQQVTIKPKTPMAFGSVRLPHYVRRSFQIRMADDPLDSGEVFSLEPDSKEQVWAYLQSQHAIPDLSQFVVTSGSLDITKLDKSPIGQIVAVRHLFSAVEIENPATRFDLVTQEKMTLLLSVQTAWKLLEKASFDYRGELRPGQTIQADIVREEVDVSVKFQIRQKGSITFMYEGIPNMASWAETHAHFQEIDKRIPPFA
jgi:hypothetical protein